MTFPAAPFTGVPESAQTFRQLQSGLLVPVNNLTARSGALSIDSFAASVSGTTVTVSPGKAVVQGATSTTQGVFECYMPTSWTQVLDAASSQDRIDLIYLRVWDDEADASGESQADLVYLVGTPGGTPVAPTIPAGQSGFKVCTVAVPHAGSPSVTQAGVLPYTAAAGGVVPTFDPSQPGSAFPGMLRFRYDRAMTTLPGPIEAWDGSPANVWRPIIPDAYPRGIMNAPKTTTANSGAVSTPEAIDASLGTYQFTAVAGRRYEVTGNGMIANGTAGDIYSIRVRDSGSNTTPTNTSTMVAEATFNCAVSGIGGRQQIQIQDDFVAAASGTHTLGVFLVRTSGTGALTLLSPAGNQGAGARSIRVKDIGNQ